MNLFLGTSGYGYKEWKGSFYPEKLSSTKMLQFYAESFNSVELNNTFRRMPKAEGMKALTTEVSKSFQFAVKSPQVITHFRRLKDVENQLGEFKDALKSLAKHRGPVLFQLPPNFKKDLDGLTTFLKLWGRGMRAAFEFRHESWFDDDVFKALRKYSCSLCVADEDDLPDPQIVNTTKWGYIRLRREKYPTKVLKSWVERIDEQGWTDCYVYFKHEETGKGPQFAKRLLSIVQKRPFTNHGGV